MYTRAHCHPPQPTFVSAALTCEQRPEQRDRQQQPREERAEEQQRERQEDPKEERAVRHRE